MSESPRCGFVAIVGRPNVGKSTLLNQILEQKISITSRKPQTTRYQILGIRTLHGSQMLFLDTPGWQRRTGDGLAKRMNRQVRESLMSVSAAVMVIDGRGWVAEDTDVARLVDQLDCPKILVMNKLDKVGEKQQLLPLIADVTRQHQFDEVIPACAKTGDNVDVLLAALAPMMPEATHMFDDDMLTDRSERFLVAEILREKLMRHLGDELPYSVSVVIDRFADSGEGTEIDASIWVERDTQKGIVIGQGGERLKTIASSARVDIERLLERHVFLRTWVKIRSGWKNDPQALDSLGFD